MKLSIAELEKEVERLKIKLLLIENALIFNTRAYFINRFGLMADTSG